jgi:hypothetical protein
LWRSLQTSLESLGSSLGHDIPTQHTVRVSINYS